MHLVIFIVAGIDDNRRVVSQPFDLIDAFCLDGCSYLWKSWIIAATEHEVVPDKYAELVADVVKGIFFPDTTTPDPAKVSLGLVPMQRALPYHKLVPIHHHLKPPPISVLSDARSKAVGRDPVRAAAKDIDAIDSEKEGLANFIRSLNQLSLPETNAANGIVKLSVIVRDTGFDIVQGLATVAVWIPELWVIDVKLDSCSPVVGDLCSALEDRSVAVKSGGCHIDGLAGTSFNADYD